MSLTISRNPAGEIVASKAEGSNWLMLNNRMVVTGIKRIRVIQFMNPQTMQMWWALDSLRMSMMAEDHGGSIGRSNEGDHEGEEIHIVEYNQHCFLYMRNLKDSGDIRLLNDKGKVMAGSNTFNTGNLCLGGDFNPFNLEAVELLILNEANADLTWEGDDIEIGNIYADGEHSIHTATSWPQLHYDRVVIPQELLDACDHFWRF